MPATVRMNTLRRAAQELGGVDTLANVLGVSAMQAERWVSGDETVPTDVFLIAVDVLDKHGRAQQGSKPAGNDTQHGNG